MPTYPVIKDLRVKARVNILLVELQDKGSLNQRPGRDGTQKKIITDIPEMVVDSVEFDTRIEDALLVIKYGYRVTHANIPPIVITEDAKSVNHNSAILHADIDTGGSNATTGFQLGTSKALGATSVAGDTSPLNSTELTDVTYTWSGLSASTKYYFRAFAQSVGTAIRQYGAVKSFVTDPTPVV